MLDSESAEAIWWEAVALVQQEMPMVADADSELRQALITLADYNMVKWDTSADTVAVHRVVQEILRSRLADGQRESWLTLSLRLLNEAAQGDTTDVRTWPRWNPLAPHVAFTVAQADRAGIVEPTTRLMNDLGLLLKTKAQHAEAEPFYRRALAIDEQSFGPAHPTVARDLNNLALLLQDTHRLAEAEPLMRRVVSIYKQSLGEEHPNVAIALNNLAGLLQDTHRLAEAEPFYRRALAIDEQNFGSTHPTVAIDLNNLALLLQDTHRLAEAEPLMRRALAIDEQSFGPTHPTVARDLNNLAQLLRATHRLAEAEPLMRRALAVDEQSFGPTHPTVARDLNNLAQLLQDTHRLAEAEPLSRRTVGIVLDFTRSTGHEHPHLRTALENYSGILTALGHSEADIGVQIQALLAECGMKLTEDDS